jgi:hypothetical protein
MSLDFFLGMFPKLLHGTWITLVILPLDHRRAGRRCGPGAGVEPS